MSQTMARKTAASREPTAKKSAAGKSTSASPAQRRTISPEQAQMIAMLDETMARLDTGIAKERSALDALLSRMANKAD